jgi:hypothetical protein
MRSCNGATRLLGSQVRMAKETKETGSPLCWPFQRSQIAAKKPIAVSVSLIQ